MKKCTKCETEKPLMEFHKDKKNKDGHQSDCKTCRKHVTAEYYARNKEKLKQQKREYYARNKEKVKQERAEFYVRNKEKILQQKRKYYAQNREKLKQQKREYYARPEVREKSNQQSREYRAQNKERLKEYQAEYRAQNKERLKQQRYEYRARKSAEQPACIYQIKNVINNKVYIGETTVGQLRWRDHLKCLRGDRHPNHKLQQDFNEHGEEEFEWSIVKELPKDKDILLLEEAREIERRIDKGEDLYNLMLTIEQIKMLKENKEEE